ncbi:MAG: outer membrane lipoprotein chaperone LolA [Halioglobus sp.]
MKKYLVTVWLILLPLWAHAQSNDPIDQLVVALQDLEQLQGQFLQRQYGQNDVLLVESRGSFKLLRPGYFSWEITAPDNQLIIASPAYVWHYDRDLETVTRRPVTDSAQMSPLQVLGGDDSVLRKRFNVEQLQRGDFTLTPRSDDVGFKQLTLHMQGTAIAGMDILDNLNQRVQISFDQLDDTSALSSEDFSFTPPDGVDLFYYDE